MAHKHTRSHHKRRLFPELEHGAPLETICRWVFDGRVIKDGRIAWRFQREIDRQVRLARSEGRVVDLQAIEAGLPWDQVPWYRESGEPA